MTALSQPKQNELSDKDNYSLARHIAYARQLDSATMTGWIHTTANLMVHKSVHADSGRRSNGGPC